MTTEWWPQSLAHIPRENPWAHDPVTVAEIKNFENGRHVSRRLTISTLVPMRGLSAVRRNLAALDHSLRTSGPRPFPQKDRAYKPRFWIDGYGSLRARYEPLVLSWQSHDRTVFAADPGFLMTYGLVPRVGDDGVTYWDDPTGPITSVVQVSAPSVYSFPNVTPAFVRISRDYLQDYLSLRKKALVQSF